MAETPKRRKVLVVESEPHILRLVRVNLQRAGYHVQCSAEAVAGDGFAKVAEWVAKLLYHVAMHETALYASTGTHRRENGHYARSIKAQKVAADKVHRAGVTSERGDEAPTL